MPVLLSPFLFAVLTMASVTSDRAPRASSESPVVESSTIGPSTPRARTDDRAEPMESLIDCAHSCDVMSGLDECIAECNERLWECVNCCLVSNVGASTGHCRAVCVDNLMSFTCRL